ncbi:hypothetical protein C8F04DRAFT_1196501 [Mycena alexandri]|uniref:Uncharacterized protein n=1 Tax=Mycena alexandri TaxID=1745969 RepID=A0AAD6S3V6_9AGAR|nr:hypothetical protein C8F04DRAFT_1196501 [Mycena alexandri]
MKVTRRARDTCPARPSGANEARRGCGAGELPSSARPFPSLRARSSIPAHPLVSLPLPLLPLSIPIPAFGFTPAPLPASETKTSRTSSNTDEHRLEGRGAPEYRRGMAPEYVAQASRSSKQAARGSVERRPEQRESRDREYSGGWGGEISIERARGANGGKEGREGREEGKEVVVVGAQVHIFIYAEKARTRTRERAAVHGGIDIA